MYELFWYAVYWLYSRKAPLLSVHSTWHLFLLCLRMHSSGLYLYFTLSSSVLSCPDFSLSCYSFSSIFSSTIYHYYNYLQSFYFLQLTHLFCLHPFYCLLFSILLFSTLHLLHNNRALTFQRVSSWRVDQDVLARVSTDSMLVRDVCIAPAPLHLGDLSGNFFAITLRKEEGSHMQNSLAISDQLSAASVLSAFSALAVYPFMNIFGVQRFGSPLPSNPEVGMRLLASDYRGTYL